MTAEPDKRSREQLMGEAVRARREAGRFQQAATLMNDQAIEETLRVRAAELETLARTLEAQAAKLTPS